MTRTLIRYKTKPDMADRNAELIAEVFEELKAAQPEGFAIFRCGSTTRHVCAFRRDRIRFRECASGTGRFQGVPERNS